MDEVGDYLEPEPGAIFPTDCSQSNETFSRVQLLYSQHIIAWPNFSECLPHCGMCQVFAYDSTYIVYNLLLIGFVLPLIGFCGLLGNGMSAFIYYRPGITIYSLLCERQHSQAPLFHLLLKQCFTHVFVVNSVACC